MPKDEDVTLVGGGAKFGSTVDCHHAALSPYFSVGLRRCPYGIFMNRSGLSDGHFAMLVLVVGRIVPPGHGSHRLNNDLFTCLLVSSVRSLSVDERHKAQDDSSRRGGRRSRRH